MSRFEENKRYKWLFKRQIYLTMAVFLFMIMGLFIVDYYFYKNIEGTETVSIFNCINKSNQIKIILFGREFISIPVR